MVWDETIVLPGSRIGRLAAFARRAGDAWYLGVLNGSDARVEWEAPADFLGSTEFLATLYRDGAPHPTGITIATGHPVRRGDVLRAELAPGGGFVAWLRPKP